MTNTTTTKFATAVTLAAALYYQRRLAYERGRLPGGGSQNERSARPQAHESLSAAARSPKPWLAQSLSRPAGDTSSPRALCAMADAHDGTSPGARSTVSLKASVDTLKSRVFQVRTRTPYHTHVHG